MWRVTWEKNFVYFERKLTTLKSCCCIMVDIAVSILNHETVVTDQQTVNI